MELKDEKLFLNEEELKEVKRANVMASPFIAGFYLFHFIRNKFKKVDGDTMFYTHVILAYRKKNYEVQ